MIQTILLILFLLSPFHPAVAKTEEAYDRVMRTGTIRCGYFEEAPFTVIDPNTGRKTGIAVDLAASIARQTGLKLIWTEAVNFSTMVTDLETGRYDMVCGSAFNIPRGGRIDYTMPYLFVPSKAYIRADDTRFNDEFDIAIKNREIKVAALDGEGSSTIAKQRYPKARFYDLPQLSDISQLLLAVADKKADIAFVIPPVFAQFNAHNPGKLKLHGTSSPFYVFSVSFALKPGEVRLKNLMDFMMRQIIASGEMDKITDRYEKTPGSFFRVRKPY